MSDEPKLSIFYPKEVVKLEQLNPKTLPKEQLKELKQVLKEKGEIVNDASALSFKRAYPYIFDGLCFIFTNCPELVERRNDPSESKYKIRIDFSHFKKASVGPDNLTLALEYFTHELRNSIGKRDNKLIFCNNELVYDELVHITPIVKKNSSRTTGLKNQPELISEIEIECYKPIFKQVVENIEDGNFFQFPKYMQGNIQSALILLQDAEILDKKILASDCRNLYESMLIFDNGLSQTIHIPLMDYVQINYPSYINKNTRKDGSINESVPKSRLRELEKKLKGSIDTFKMLSMLKQLDGARFIPVEFEKIDTWTNLNTGVSEECIFINVIRPKNKKFPTFDLQYYFDYKKQVFYFCCNILTQILKRPDTASKLIKRHFDCMKSFITDTVQNDKQFLEYLAKDSQLKEFMIFFNKQSEQLNYAKNVYDKKIEEINKKIKSIDKKVARNIPSD